MHSIVLLVLMVTTAAPRPPITVEPELKLSAADTKALYRATSAEKAEGIDVRNWDILGTVAIVYGPAVKASGICSGAASLYAFEDGSWARASMGLSYAIVNEHHSCAPDAKHPRILLVTPIPAEDTAAVVAAIRSRKIASDEKGKVYDIPLRSDNIIEAIELNGTQASVSTKDGQGEPQTVLLTKLAGQWVVFAAGEGVALARE